LEKAWDVALVRTSGLEWAHESALEWALQSAPQLGLRLEQVLGPTLGHASTRVGAASEPASEPAWDVALVRP
jgi:hypothetical protein